MSYKKEFAHNSLNLQDQIPIVFTSFSKHNFYLRFQISAFVLLSNHVPVSPFMNFDYNLAGLVDKKQIRVANNTLIKKSDELWVFGNVSDGVLVEIFLARKDQKNVRFFIPNERIDQFKEIPITEVKLEDVSPWMWEWILKNRNLERWHPRLRLKKTYPVVYPAYSKHNFFWQMQISQFCIERNVVPLNPFMLFRYFLGDIVPREIVYRANNNIVKKSNEIWTFGQISDGVLAEIKLAKDNGTKVKHFNIVDSNPVGFRRTNKMEDIQFEEPKLKKFKSIIKS